MSNSSFSSRRRRGLKPTGRQIMKRIDLIRYSFITALIIMFITTGFSAAGAPTPAGTLITNRARVDYKNMGGEPYEAQSNTVTTTVLVVPGVDISDGVHISSAPGMYVLLHHVLTNTSNAPQVINIDVFNPLGFPYEIFHDTDHDMNLTVADALFDDTDGDGLLDTGTMASGSSTPMIVRVWIPAGTDLSTEATFGFTAFSSLDAEVIDYAENTISVNDARPYIDVHDSPLYAYLDTWYEFKVSFGNLGDILFEPADIEVEIPSSLEFVSAGGTFVYDSVGRKLTWDLVGIEPETSGTFTVRVRVASAGAVITYVENKATLTGGSTTCLSDSEQTGLVTANPATISLIALPDTIVADGYSRSLLTATVLDILGNPVPDGTTVTFGTAVGTFLPNGMQSYVATTTGGTATVYLVSTLMHGFESVTSLVEVKAGTPETGEVYATVTMTFEPAGILGIVWNSDEDAPVPGVSVELLDSSGTVINSTNTGADGRYMLAVPAIGEYSVRVNTDDVGYGRIVLMSVDIEELQGSLWSTPGAILGMTYADIAAPAGSAAVSSLSPMAGALVSLYKDGALVAEDITDDAGEFMFLNLPLGDYMVLASTQLGLVGYSEASLRHNGEVLIAEIVTLFERGLVYDASSLAPIPGAEVTLLYVSGPLAGTIVPLPLDPSFVPQENPALSNIAGHYIFFAEAGDYLLSVKAFGYRDYLSDPLSHDGFAINERIPMRPMTSEDLSLVKKSSRGAAAPGEKVKFSLEWENTSGGQLQEVKLIDRLPVELIVDEDSISGLGVYDPVGHSITWDYNLVNGSGSTHLETFFATVDETVEDGKKVLNRAEVSSVSGAIASSSVMVAIARKPGIVITKAAGSKSVSTGDIVTYRVVVANREDVLQPMAALVVAVEDTLPAGFFYIPGSTYIDGAPAADPEISGSVLSWQLAAMPSGTTRQIIYKAGIRQGAAIGKDSINYAFVYGTGEFGYPFEEGPASASVIVSGPAFSSLGAIVGKVFNDKDGDGFQDKDEEGIAGAEIIMDDGTRAITGEGGLYHIGQVKPGVRSIKLNMASLPYKAQMTNSFTDFTGTSSSFFVDVYPSSTARADFAVRKPEAGGNTSLTMEIQSTRVAKLENGAATVLVRLNLVNTGASVIKGAKISAAGATSDANAAVKRSGGAITGLEDLKPGERRQVDLSVTVSGAIMNYSSLLTGVLVYMPGDGVAASEILARGSAVTVLHNTIPTTPVEGFAIISPEMVSFSQLGHISIKTSSPLNADTRLVVNGVTVPKDKVGTITRDGSQDKLFLEYVSVEIRTGENRIELIDERSGMNVAEAIVLLADRPDRSVIISIPSDDGLNIGSKIAAAALTVDGMGLPAGRYMMPSFHATGAEFAGKDAKPQDEGFQVIGGDMGNYDLLLSTQKPENGVRLSAIIGSREDAADLTALKAKTKPAVITGTIELHHALGDFRNSYIKGRAYLRKEFQDGVLTLRYDSEQGTADGLFSSAGADTMYGLYGDTSVQDNASPAASPFFAKFAAKGFYAMWGDFQPLYQGAELSSFKSVFTGFSLGANLNRFTFGAFAAPIKDGIKTDRMAADGTSGYFFLGDYPVLAGSESIYILLTSAVDATIVLERIPLKRAVDYVVDYTEGSLLLTKPVPSYDALNNRYFIEAVYTTLGTTEVKGLAAGGRVHADLGSADFGLSTAVLTDFDSINAIIGADFGINLGDPLRLVSEAAVSFDGDTYKGYAVKAGAYSRIGKVSLSIEVTATDGGFVKPGETAPLPRQIALVGKAEVDKGLPLILSFASGNYWKGASYAFTSENKLTTGYKLPLGFDASLGLITTFAYDESSDSFGAIFDAFAEVSPIPKLRIAAFAQIAKIGEIKDADGDYRLSITYKPSNRVSASLSYVTGISDSNRHHALLLSADVAITKEGKVFGTFNAPLGHGSAKVLSLGYSDGYKLAEGLRTSFLIEGSLGFTEAGIDHGSTKASLSGSIKYTAVNGFTATLKQEVGYGMTEGVKSLTQLSLSGKPAEWLTLEGTASAYYGNSPNRNGLPLVAEAGLQAALRPDNTIYTGLLKAGIKYYRGEHFGIDEAALVTTAVTDWTIEAGRYLSLGAKAAYKLAAEGPAGAALSLNNLMLLQSSVSFHITRTTDLEVFVRGIGWAEDWRVGYSAQVVQKIFNMLSVAAGYNSKDLSDTDIIDRKPWTEGFYLKFMVKF